MPYDVNIEDGSWRWMPGRNQPELPFSVWLNTEGGRKCPMCGRYAKSSELGWIGGNFNNGLPRDDPNYQAVHLDAYGHLPGYGCNAPTPHPQPAPPEA